MKIQYDSEVDVLQLHWSNDAIEESDETKPGIILDYNEEGIVIGVEILKASEQVENWKQIEKLTIQNN